VHGAILTELFGQRDHRDRIDRRTSVNTAGDDHHRDAGARSAAGESCDRLAVTRLRVQRSFSGNHERCTIETGIESDRIENQIDARFDRRADHGAQSERNAACGAHPGFAPVSLREESRKTCKAAVEFRDLLGRRTLLRSEYSRRTVRTVERVSDIACDAQVNARIAHDAGAFDAGDSWKTGSGHRLRDLGTRVIEEADTERLGSAASGVTCGASADPENDLIAPGVKGSEYQFPGPESSRQQRVAFMSRNKQDA